MLTEDGLVKILDFGLARPDPASPSPSDEQTTLDRLTDAGTVLGTVGYMSPEQARSDTMDFRSDQFALGAILYELATGRGPFQRKTPAETIAAILRDDPQPVSAINPQTPPGMARIIERCLAKTPSRRYASSLDLARDLHEELTLVSGTSGAAAAKGTRGRRGRVAGIALGLVAAAAAAWLLPRLLPRRGPIGSLAILPFVNASGDPGLDYLSDGLTESLINSVSQLSNLKVIARSSVFRYKGKDVTPDEAAQQLKVQAVMMGRISERGDQLSVSAELVDAVENTHLWGVQYNRKPSDLIATQEDIAREISENLRVKLSGDEKRQLVRRYTQDDEAYRLYLRGRYFWNLRTRNDLEKSVGYFRQAIARDSAYALAYSGLADALATVGLFYYQFAPPRETFAPAREAAMKSLELDPSLGEAHNSLANVMLYYDWDWASAEREFKRALELNPTDTNARHWYSHYLLALGRFDESLAQARRAVEQDPISPMMTTHLAEHYHLSRQDDLAIGELKRALELSPRFPVAHVLLGEAYESKHRYSDAEGEFQSVADLFAGTSKVLGALARIHALEGKRAQAQRELQELADARPGRYVAPHDLAWGYGALGDKDRAMQWLEKACAERSSALVYLKIEPLFDSLRQDKRFAEFVRRVGLPP